MASAAEPGICAGVGLVARPNRPAPSMPVKLKNDATVGMARDSKNDATWTSDQPRMASALTSENDATTGARASSCIAIAITVCKTSAAVPAIAAAVTAAVLFASDGGGVSFRWGSNGCFLFSFFF